MTSFNATTMSKMKERGVMLVKSWTLSIPQISILRILTALKIKVVLGEFAVESHCFLQF